MTYNYGPGSWEANRSEVGAAILGTTWSSVFAGLASTLALNDPDSGWVDPLWTLAGLAGLVALVALTTVGCRLAFVSTPHPQPDPRSAAPTTAVTGGPADGTPSVRIVAPNERRSDAKVALLMILGGVLAVFVIVGVLVLALG